VRAFYCEDEAKGFVAELQAHADRLKAWKDEDWERWDAEPPESPEVAHPLDSNYDDSGTTYSHYQLDLVGKKKALA
jgi:hypothetical protein